ncbi:MAG TPA: hypothetical protein VF701_08075 [Thermoanaerobaculia bacterium]
MNHVSQEELVLCYYADPGSEGAQEHVARCEECAGELARLAMVLDRVTPAEVPEPPAGYEAQVWRRLHWRLRRERRPAAVWMKWGAAAALVVVAFTSGLLWKKRSEAPDRAVTASSGEAANAEANGAAGRDRILLVVVSDHMARSERILVELTNMTPNGGVDITAEQLRVEELLASNRIYRRTASERGEDSVATLLDELEPVLMQLANGPSTLTADELRGIQKRVETRGLVFKLRVVRAGVDATPAPPLQPNI